MKKNSFENLSQWWDVGKVNIKMFCQNYAFHSSNMLKATVDALQSDTEFVEKQAVNNNEAVQCIELKKKRQELSLFLHEQAKVALIRSRYCSIKDMDAPSTFFFKCTFFVPSSSFGWISYIRSYTNEEIGRRHL